MLHTSLMSFFCVNVKSTCPQPAFQTQLPCDREMKLFQVNVNSSTACISDARENEIISGQRPQVEFLWKGNCIWPASTNWKEIHNFLCKPFLFGKGEQESQWDVRSSWREMELVEALHVSHDERGSSWLVKIIFYFISFLVVCSKYKITTIKGLILGF